MQFNKLEPGGVEKESTEQNTQKYVKLESSCDDEPQCNTLPETVIRCPERNRRPPDFYGEWANLSLPKEWLKINSRRLET